MNIIHTTLPVGATAPFTIIHLSDTHLTYADLRDGQRKVDLIDWRLPSFPNAEKVLAEAGELSRELNAPIFHTGIHADVILEASLHRGQTLVAVGRILLGLPHVEGELMVARGHVHVVGVGEGLHRL